MDSKWLYRAAGTVGLAGGFLLLGAANAQAGTAAGTDAELLDGLTDVFSPTAGLPPVDLALDAPASPAAGTVILDPSDGREGFVAGAPAWAGEPEVLPSLPALPALGPLLGMVPSGTVPLDALGLPGGAVGAGLPLSDLASLDGDLVGLPTRFAGDAPRTLPAVAGAPLAGTPLADAAAAGAPVASAESAEIVGPTLLMGLLAGGLPVGALPVGGLPTGALPVGDLSQQVPVAGPMVTQTANNLPLVSNMVPLVEDPNRQRPHTPAVPAPAPSPAVTGASNPLDGPITGDAVPAVIAEDLLAEGQYSPELLQPEVTGGLPLLGPALQPLSRMVGVGNLAGQLPLAGPLAGPALGNLPVVSPAGHAAPASSPLPTDLAGLAGAGGVAEDRPVVAEDPEYHYGYGYGYYQEERAAEAVPLGAISQLPLAAVTSQLPLDGLPSSGALLGSLPVVDSVPAALPL